MRLASVATQATRVKVITATNRSSASNWRAISVMAVAAPGIEPHSAAVPGSTCQRVSATPTITPIASVAAVVPMNTSGSPATIASNAGLNEVAISRPTTL